ncbi:glycosyltransferase [Gangjinia marincola]|uniref:Glycosyltransferase n=1 Tax=Gangjinia marincola TaxID=578463 RepID=A0ABN1MDM3_9FLAO
MKILLVGEYSRLHNSLKEGLHHLGHEVTIIATGDNFKNYPVDLNFKATLVERFWVIRKFKNLLFRVTGIDLGKTERGIRFGLQLKKLKGFDVVQLINSNAIGTHLWLQRRFILALKKHNATFFLSVCGEETPIVQYYLDQKFTYDLLEPLRNQEVSTKQYAFTLAYTKEDYLNFYTFVEEQALALIPSDLDYLIPLQHHPKTHFIPNPINIDRFTPSYYQSGKIELFLGINRMSAVKKGIHFFVKALKIIQDKYPEKVSVTITESIPYDEYIQIYRNAHILLDNVYAYDQGFNALEAMAQGKVVFTGAEKEFVEHYALKETVAINSLPNVDYLVTKLSDLIEHPESITQIGQNARKFIEEHHHYITVASQFEQLYLSHQK